MRKGNHSKRLSPGDQAQIISLHNRGIEICEIMLYIPAKKPLSFALRKYFRADMTSFGIERVKETATLWDRCLVKINGRGYCIAAVTRIYKIRHKH